MFLILWKKVKMVGQLIYNLQSIFLFVVMIGITVLVTIQVILRYVFYHPLMGIEELLLFPTIWLFFLGSANASWERTQIKAKIIEVLIKSEKIKKLFNIIMALISFIISFWLTYWSYSYLQHSLKIGKLSPTLYIPLFYAEGTIFVGFLIMTVYVFIELIDHIIELIFDIRGKKKVDFSILKIEEDREN